MTDRGPVKCYRQLAALLYSGVAALWNITAFVMFFAFKQTPQYESIMQAHKKAFKSVLVHDQLVAEIEEENVAAKAQD